GGGGDAIYDQVPRSTTLVVVATNVTMTKTQLTKVAMMANCGAARAVRPYHTTGDGDQLFAASTRRLRRDDVNVTTVGTLAAEVVSDAIVRAVLTASSVTGWPAAKELKMPELPETTSAASVPTVDRKSTRLNSSHVEISYA